MLGGASEHSGGWDTRRAPPPVHHHRMQPGAHHRTEIYTLKKRSPEAELMFAIYQGGAQTPPSPPPSPSALLLAETEVCGWILKPESTPPITRTRVSVKTQDLTFFSPTTPASCPMLHLSQSGRPQRTPQRCRRPRLTGELQAAGGLLGE